MKTRVVLERLEELVIENERLRDEVTELQGQDPEQGPLRPEQLQPLIVAVIKGNKIKMIKEVRMLCGVGLKEAKENVDSAVGQVEESYDE